MISRHLSDIQASGETAALVYDIGISGQQYALCVWLFSAKGMEAAVTAPIAEQSPFQTGVGRDHGAQRSRCRRPVGGPRTAASPRSRRGAALAGKGACVRAGDRRGLVAADAGRDLGKSYAGRAQNGCLFSRSRILACALRGAAVG